MCTSIETADDELNFVLGNDVGRLLGLDLDAALADRNGEVGDKNDGGRDEEDPDPSVPPLPATAPFVAAAAGTPPAITNGDDNELNFQPDVRLSRTVSVSPGLGIDENAPAGPSNQAFFDHRGRQDRANDALIAVDSRRYETLAQLMRAADSLAMANTSTSDPVDDLLAKLAPPADGDPFFGPSFEDSPVFEDAQMNQEPLPEFRPAIGADVYAQLFNRSPLFNDGGLDFSTDGSDKLTDPPVLEDFQDFDFDLAVVDGTLDGHEPLGDPYLTLGLPDDSSRPTPGSPPPPLPESPAPAPEAPVVRAAHLLVAPKRPLPRRRGRPRKRKAEDTPPDRTPQEEPRPVPPLVRAAEARRARANRRHRRARGQAVNLVGGGEVSEIERRSAEDASNVDPGLLADFVVNFDPEVFVKAALEQICAAMAEINEATAAVPSVPAPPMPTPSGTVDSGAKGRETPSKTPSKTSSKKSSKKAKPAAVVTPPSLKENDDPGLPHLKTLPSGKDPESRRLRQLMRNRLSAQASRDRRRRAIEEAKQVLAKKEGELRALEEAVSEETRRAAMLEKAVDYARRYLGPEKYSKVAGLDVDGVTKPGANIIESN